MKNLWALPALIRLALAAPSSFSIQNDLLAYPQYELIYSESYIPSRYADTLLAGSKDLPFTSKDRRHLTPEDVQYLTPTDIDLKDASDSTERKEHYYKRMVLHSRPYLCKIPIVSEYAANRTSQSEEDEQKELARASDNGWELLKGMEGRCLYRGEGWWWYSFCFNEGVKQFHPLPPGKDRPPFPPQEDMNVDSFVLGRVPDAKSQKTKKVPKDKTRSAGLATTTDLQIRQQGDTNYLVQNLGDGTTCDLTGAQRKIEIQYHCRPESPDNINMIKETTSCNYLMIIHTPRLCNDLAFMPPQIDKPNPITCREIVAPEEETAWKQAREEEIKIAWQIDQDLNEAEEALRKGDLAHALPIKIGGIEVGAQIYVGGSPDRTISGSLANPPKQPELLNPGEEKFIATLASSDGKFKTVMSEAEIRKHGINEIKQDSLNKLIANVEDFARDGQPWKIDVYQTRKGFEYRGIRLEEGDDPFAEESDGSGVGQTPETTTGGFDSKEREGSQEEYKQEL